MDDVKNNLSRPGTDPFGYRKGEDVALARLRDAGLQRLLEAAWEAHEVLHRTAVADMDPDNEVYEDGVIDMHNDGFALGAAEQELGRLYVEGLRDGRPDPLADLPREMREDCLWMLVGQALVKIFYDEGLSRISRSEAMWCRGDWDGLLRNGYVSRAVHERLSRAYPGGNPRTAKRREPGA